MNCLSLAQVYLYLEGELTPPERQHLEEHLVACRGCREAVEARRLLAEAASTLPDLEIPADFSRTVMGRIAGTQLSLKGWLVALAAGCSAALAALALATVVTHQSLPGLFVALNRYLWSNLKTLSLSAIKFSKVVLLFLNIFFNALKELVEGLSVLTSLISPQVQILLITLTLLLSATLFMMLKRKLRMRDNHEH